LTVRDRNSIRRAEVYCLAPPELAGQAADALDDSAPGRRQFRVLVERRREERRSAGRRREVAPADRDRRRIRNPNGRRVADRRALVALLEPPELPRHLRRVRDQLIFVERVLPPSKHVADVESNRLAIRYQGGDKSAMTALYEQHFDEIFSYARVALRDADEAEDVAQQVFANAFQALARYEVRAGVPFRSWLFGIARNAVIDAVRARQRFAVLDPVSLDVIRDRTDDTEVAAKLSWLSDGDLFVFVERLPESQRQAIVLRYLLDMSTAAIASAMNKTPKAVQRLQERGLETLEDRLVATGRRPTRRVRVPMLMRLRPAPVMAARRFALGVSLRSGDWGLRPALRRSRPY
jgi:RNA polymerase sigma-70 factor (ECF subfamily)